MLKAAAQTYEDASVRMTLLLGAVTSLFARYAIAVLVAVPMRTTSDALQQGGV